VDINTNPYVGPRTFTRSDSDRFYGREQEAADLLSLVLAEREVLFYSQSGTGKSSLINARLIPRLREQKFGTLPLARVSGEIPADIESAQIKNIFVFNLLLAINQGLEKKDQQSAISLAGLTLTRFLGEEPPAAAGAESNDAAFQVQPTVLIIDQFEEIVTTHLERWQDRAGFFEQLSQAMIDHPQLWLVLVMREDFVAALDPYARLLPGRLRTRFYMERMGVDAALDAVTEPAAQAGRPFTPAAASKLVNNLRQVRLQGQQASVLGEYVEPVQLQVVCYQIWENIRAAGKTEIVEDDLHQLGDVDLALRRFYEEALAAALQAAPDAVSEQQLRTWFDEELLTEAGTRGTVYQGPHDTEGLPNVVIDVLARRFLLRPVVRAGDTWFELIHDRMIGPIVAANGDWRRQHQNPLRMAAERWSTEGQSTRLAASGETLASFQKQLEKNPHEFSDLEREFVRASLKTEELRLELITAQRLALLEREKYLSETGWGVIFPSSGDPAVREAIKELLDYRRGQATAKKLNRYREFYGPKDGCRPDETARSFLERHGAATGDMPYYLLLVGTPEEISYSFQYQLDVEYAVGRVDFEALDEYRRYAASVVAAERKEVTRPRTASFFVPKYSGSERANYGAGVVVTRPEEGTRPGTARPVLPSHGEATFAHYVGESSLPDIKGKLELDCSGWAVEIVAGDQATKQRLRELLSDGRAPAVLFASGKGVRLKESPGRRRDDDGGLWCVAGTSETTSKENDPNRYFLAADLAENSQVQGLVAVLACDNSVGTPQYDGFALLKRGRRKRDVDQPFVARLAQRLLSHPAGGALAVIGRIEPSIDGTGPGNPARAPVGEQEFVPMLQRLLNGFPVGAVLDPINRRYAVLAADLFEHNNSGPARRNASQSDIEGLRTNVVEMRSWAIVGDPAVRVAVPDIFPDLTRLQRIYESDAKVSEARRAARAGNLEEAVALYNDALDKNPTLVLNPELEARRLRARDLVAYGRCLARQREVKEAVAAMEEARTLDPSAAIDPERILAELAAPAFLEEGERLAASGKVSAATTQFRRAMQYDATLGIEPARRAAEIATRFFLQEGDAAAALGDVPTATSHFRRAAELSPDPKFDPAVEAGRRAAPFFYEKGSQLAGRGDVEGATDAFRTVLKLHPQAGFDPAARAKELAAQVKAREMVQQGRRKVMEGKTAAAIALFRKAKKINPSLAIDPEREARRLRKLKPSFGLKKKLWKPGTVLRVRFLGGNPVVQKRVMEAALEWTKYANIRFKFGDDPDSEIRITFSPGSGSWSYLGTDARIVKKDEPTMNFGWLTPDTPNPDMSQVVLHEFGRALALMNEHQSPNAAIRWNEKVVFNELAGPPNNWTRDQVDVNVFRKFRPADMAIPKEFDPESIMMYAIPKEWTLDGFSCGFNIVALSELDKEAIGRLYPFGKGKTASVRRTKSHVR